MKIWFQNHRYKTKKAQKDREKIDQKPTGLQLHHHHQHQQQQPSHHQQQNTTSVSSPKRVAVPVLVKDGKPCSGNAGGGASSSAATSGSAATSAHRSQTQQQQRDGRQVSPPSSPASSASSAGGDADCCDHYQPSLTGGRHNSTVTVGSPVDAKNAIGSNGRMATHHQHHLGQQRASCGGGHQFLPGSMTSPIKNAGSGAASSSLAAQLHQASLPMPAGGASCLSGLSPPPLHVGRAMSTAVPQGGGGGLMANGAGGGHMSSPFGPPMMMSSRNHIPSAVGALSLHDTMSYADFASPKSCFFNGRTW